MNLGENYRKFTRRLSFDRNPGGKKSKVLRLYNEADVTFIRSPEYIFGSLLE